MDKYMNYQLCYMYQINEYYYEVFFTSNLDKQWGDDWNDTPASCNAESPYDSETDVYRVLINLPWSSDQIFGGDHFSVENLNKRMCPWLKFKEMVFWGGSTLQEVIKNIEDYNKYFSKGYDKITLFKEEI